MIGLFQLVFGVRLWRLDVPSKYGQLDQPSKYWQPRRGHVRN